MTKKQSNTTNTTNTNEHESTEVIPGTIERTEADWPYEGQSHVVTTISVKASELMPTIQYGNLSFEVFISAKVKPGEDWRPITRALLIQAQSELQGATWPYAKQRIQLNVKKLAAMKEDERRTALQQLVAVNHLMDDNRPDIAEMLQRERARVLGKQSDTPPLPDEPDEYEPDVPESRYR